MILKGIFLLPKGKEGLGDIVKHPASPFVVFIVFIISYPLSFVSKYHRTRQALALIVPRVSSTSGEFAPCPWGPSLLSKAFG